MRTRRHRWLGLVLAAAAAALSCSEEETSGGVSPDASSGAGGGGQAGAGGGAGAGGSPDASADHASDGAAAPSACDELGPRPGFAPQYDVLVKTSDDAAALLSAAPEGARIAFEAGIHRIGKPLKPRASQRLYGLPGAILSGAKLLTGWTSADGIWSVGGQTHAKVDDQKPCRSTKPRCGLVNDVFLDGVRLEPAPSVAEVGPGESFFDAEADTIHIGTDPTGHVVETAILEVAVDYGGAGVRVENLVIEKFASHAQEGAVRAGSGWTIEHVELRQNHGIGLKTGDKLVLRGSYIHHQGQMGLGGGGESVLVEGNHIAQNNTAGYDPFWEAGGTKFVYTTGLVVKANCSHDNDGPGFWTDINNQDTRYEANVAEGNTRPGIFHEISYAAVITANTCRKNGAGGPWYFENSGILVTNSSNVEIYGNVLEDNGIHATQDDRLDGAFGPWEVANLHVHDNLIDMASGSSGLSLIVITDSVYFTGKNNRFLNNQYGVDELGEKQWRWSGGAVDFATWQGYGHDVTGSVAVQ